VQARVLERKPRGGPGGLEQRSLPGQARVVNQRGERLPVGADQRDRAVG
jgi:hypothetical protein